MWMAYMRAEGPTVFLSCHCAVQVVAWCATLTEILVRAEKLLDDKSHRHRPKMRTGWMEARGSHAHANVDVTCAESPRSDNP